MGSQLSQGPEASSRVQDWSDCVDEEADLSLLVAHAIL